MKKRIAYILFFLFVSSFVLETGKDIFAAADTNITLTENEEDADQKNTEEKDCFCKDKLVQNDYTFAVKSSINQNYNTASLDKLPNPYLTKQIRPPRHC